jgi:hypothetical protein
LSGNHDQGFLQIEPAGQSLLLAANIGFVDFDATAE